MEWGLDADSIGIQQASGVEADYAMMWVGPWNLEKGWLWPEAQLAQLRALNVTPAIQLYYWGDDLTPACLQSGCHGKDLAGWDALADGLVARLQSEMGGAPVLVILETEFNKGGVARHEPLDALLAQKARDVKDGYPAARVVLGLGDWNPGAWPTWDRAAAASDALGVQALAGSAPPAAGEASLFDKTLAGAAELRRLYGKPIVLQDVAVASAPEPATNATQGEELARFVDGLPALREAGVEAILYRSYLDAPGVPLGAYFGEAERHFGLAGPDGPKPGGEAWLEAMAADRAPRCPAPQAPESCS